MFRRFLILLLLLFAQNESFGQYPSYFNYSIENGGPSNEVYCILQDSKGYIWIGCDAGLYRYNGIRFEHFSSPDLTSRSVSGVCESIDGTIYANNFNGQILYVQNGHLKVLKGWDKTVNHLAPDKKGKLWVTTSSGLYCINTKTKKINECVDLDKNGIKDNNKFTSSLRVHSGNHISFINDGRVIEYADDKTFIYKVFSNERSVPIFSTNSKGKPWSFKMIEGEYYVPKKNGYIKGNNKQLIAYLKNRKITNTQEIDNEIWISTHSGIIRYSKKTGKTELLYPQFAFSSCLKDSEGNYWFTTLHNGILRMPRLSFKCWNSQTGATNSNQFSSVIVSNEKAFFATTDGLVGEINCSNSDFKLPLNPLKSDIGAIYYDASLKQIYYNKMNSVFVYKNGKSQLLNDFTRPAKDFYRLKNKFLVASSQGLYLFTDENKGFKEIKAVNIDWCREFLKSPFSNKLFVAGNHGLYEYRQFDDSIQLISKRFNNKQISSICSDENQLYLLTFDGLIYSLNKYGELSLLLRLNEQQRAVQIRQRNGKLFLATNIGLFVYEINTSKKWNIDTYDGLASNNINGIAFSSQFCWLSTGNGLQKIALNQIKKRFSQGKIILRKINVNGKEVNKQALKELNHADNLSLNLDGLSFRSNGRFSYAYRFKGDKQVWIKVPATEDELTIPRLPFGNIEMELKLIDHEGKDSANLLKLNLHVQAPFWQRWWFYFLLTLTVISISYLIFKKRLEVIRKRQDQKLQQLKLENELRLTQQNAIKAQMNPHFLFNVLNSIKGYIYENDKKNAARYLSDFSSLVRRTLDLSSMNTVSLSSELETIQLYVNLESMLLEEGFNFQLLVDSEIDSEVLQIPSLLLQPYVENSFKHGLRHKKGFKELIILVIEDAENEQLIIEIKDNGIGRKASLEINSKKDKRHESFATNAIQKRIELLNFENEGAIKVEIIDLFDSLGNIAGTNVKITLKTQVQK